VLDAAGVLANEQRLEMVNGAHDGQLAPGEARFTYAVDALIGVDNDKEKVAVSRPDGVGGNVGDLHAIAPCAS